jgi:hypothetical protein
MMGESRKIQITEFLEVVRGLIDSTELTIVGTTDASAFEHRIKQCIVRLQVAEKNLQFAIDGLEETYRAIYGKAQSAPAVVGPDAR